MREQYLWTWRQSVVPNDAPRDFGPEVAFGTKVQMPVARQGGREVSGPRPYVTNLFHPLSSTYSIASFPYICQRFPVTSSKWYVKVHHGTVGIQKLRMCFSKTMSLRLKTINQITWRSLL